MSTFGNLVRRIRTDLNRGAQHDPRIKEAIADAILHFRANRLGFNQKRSQTVLGPNQEFLALPTDWLEVDHLRLETDSDRQPLSETSYLWIEDRQRGTGYNGEPTHFAIHARELRFYPVPERSYTLVMSFQCDLPQVSVSASDAATNGWMTEGEQLVRTYALGDLLVNYVGGSEVERGLVLKIEAEENILPLLQRRAARENTSGHIRAFL